MRRFNIGLSYPAGCSIDVKLIREGDIFDIEKFGGMVVLANNSIVDLTVPVNKKVIRVSTYYVDGESADFSGPSQYVDISSENKRKFVKLYRQLHRGGMLN